MDGVIWLSLEELGQQADLDPLLALLALPVRSEAELPARDAGRGLTAGVAVLTKKGPDPGS